MDPAADLIYSLEASDRAPFQGRVEVPRFVDRPTEVRATNGGSRCCGLRPDTRSSRCCPARSVSAV